MKSSATIQLKDIKLLGKKVIVRDMDHGLKKTYGGIIVLDNDMTERGIVPRWALVAAVGPEVTTIKPGEWVLIEHGKWTPGLPILEGDDEIKIWWIDFPKSVLLASTVDPRLETLKTAPKLLDRVAI